MQQEYIPQRERIHYVWLALGALTVGFIAYNIVLGIAVVLKDFIGSTLFLLSFPISQGVFLFGVVHLFAKFLKIPNKEIYKLNLNKSARNWLLIIPISIGIQLFTNGYVNFQQSIVPQSWLEFYQKFAKYAEDMYSSIFGNGNIGLVLLAGAVTPAIFEELVFRGFFLSASRKQIGIVAAVILNGLVFSMVHGNPVDAIPLWMIGSTLAYITLRSGSLYYAMLLHLINNSIAFVGMIYFPEISSSSNATEVMPLYYSIPSIIAGAAIVWWSAKKMEGKIEQVEKPLN